MNQANKPILTFHILDYLQIKLSKVAFMYHAFSNSEPLYGKTKDFEISINVVIRIKIPNMNIYSFIYFWDLDLLSVADCYR
jgi:hypothetical protein